MIIRYFIAPFMFWLGILSSYSQNQGIVDSLNQAYKAAEHDTDKINCLFALGEVFIGPDPDTCLIINKRALELAEQNLTTGSPTLPDASLKKKYLSFLASALNNIGYIYQNKGDIDKGLEYFHKSLKIKEETGDKKGMANSLINIGYVYQSKGEIDKGLEYYHKSLKIKEELGDKKGVAYSLNNIGAVYYYKGDIAKGLEYYRKSLKINKEIGDKKGMAYSLNNIGAIYYYQGDIAKGLEYYHKSLKIEEEIGDKKGVANSLNNIGAIYEHQGDIAKGLECYNKSLKIYEKIGDKKGVAESLNNIGAIYEHQGDIAKGLEYYHKGLKLREEIGDKKGVAYSLNNIGAIYEHQGGIAKGLEYYHKSLKIYEEIEDKKGVAESLNNIGYIYLNKGELGLVKEYAKRSMKLAEELGFPVNIRNAAELLSKTHRKEGNFKQAIEMYELYIQMRDSIKNEETQKASIKQQFKYDYEKREAVANAQHHAELERQEAVAAEEQKKQNIIIGSVSGGLGLVVLFSIFLFNRFQVIRRQKALIEEQKKEVEKQKAIVDEKNKDITDSIRYAQNIQEAILPNEEEIKKALPAHFIYFQPRDIVSGDFYWFANKNGKTFIAACDCTGHGVPGAFVSMIGNDLLNQIIIEKGIENPGEILTQLNNGVKSVFTREDSEQQAQDGMDMVLCVFDKDLKTLEFAGANNPLLLIQNGEIKRIKGDKHAIGGDTEIDCNFTNHKIGLQKGNTIYIFSDGYQDQFGGVRNKKFGSKRFREFLFSIQDESIQEQKEIIHKTIMDWKQDSEQVDDILVIGIRV